MKEVKVGEPTLLILEWGDVVGVMKSLANAIQESYKPDIIVGVLRGGAVVACLLSDMLSVYRVSALGLRRYRGVYERSSVEVYQRPDPREVTGASVLLVDDVSDEGETFRVAIEQVLKPLKPKELKTASLHVKPWTAFLPDYYAERTSSWVVYPWGFYETVRDVGGKLVKELGLERTADLLAGALPLSRKEVVEGLGSLE